MPERGIYLLRKCLERSDVSPGTRTHRRREEDAEGGEAKAALALLGGLAPVEDTNPALGVFCEVAVCGGGRRFRKRCERRAVKSCCGVRTRRPALPSADR